MSSSSNPVLSSLSPGTTSDSNAAVNGVLSDDNDNSLEFDEEGDEQSDEELTEDDLNEMERDEETGAVPKRKARDKNIEWDLFETFELCLKFGCHINS